VHGSVRIPWWSPSTYGPPHFRTSGPRDLRDSPAMLARILAVGDELLLGRTVDTNSSHIARWLTDRGFHVDRTVVVGDPQRDIEVALRAASDGAALMIITGGLGPTDDDRTRQALAAVMGVPLAERPAAWARIRRWYRTNLPNRPIPAINRRQALVPRGADLLANDRGTAPGLTARIGGCRVACMPGVPHEMMAMLARLDRPLKRWFPRLRRPAIGEAWIAGLGESAAQERIGDLLTEQHPQVGITVSEKGHITLRVVGTASEVRTRVRALRQMLAPYLLPADGPAASLVALLAKEGRTIAAAESCTCGQVVAQLGAISGASAVLRESLVAYHEGVKRSRLGVTPALLRRHGVVSEAVAMAMARGMRRHARADLAIATTGIAGPGGGTPATPVGTVCVAVADRTGVAVRTIRIRGSRERVQARAAAQALVMAVEVACGRLATRPSDHI
jgi:nicotinamide-nucleotide amidase